MGLLLLTKATVAKTQQEVVVRIETLGQWKGTINVNQGKLSHYIFKKKTSFVA